MDLSLCIEALVCPNDIEKLNRFGFTLFTDQLFSYLPRAVDRHFFPAPILQNTIKVQFSCLRHNLRRKTVYVNIWPVSLL